MELINDVFDTRGFLILAGIFFFLFFMEGIFRLRIRKEGRMRRVLINGLFSIPGFIALRFLLIPALVWLACQNEQWQIGLNYGYSRPLWLEGTIAFLLLDYGNFVWHIMNHKIKVLWRFHLVHHTDRDMDVTTAIRFHFVEIVTSIVVRGFIVLMSGASPLLVLVYEICFEAANQFHHSNWKIPFRMEQLINLIFVTPRMHGIHHSAIRRETDSNYSVIFSIWDRIHRTANLNVPQDAVVIGVPVYSDPKELTPAKLMGLPFTRIREWEKETPPRGQRNPGRLAR